MLLFAMASPEMKKIHLPNLVFFYMGTNSNMKTTIGGSWKLHEAVS